jgi:hypothetical protein
MVATMCERGSSTATNAMKTEVHLEPVVDSEDDTVQELLAAATRIKTMPARPTIERSSISPRVVVVDNSQGIFQLVGPKGKVFIPRRVLLDSGAEPLMLGASAVAGLELTKDTLEECPWAQGAAANSICSSSYWEPCGFICFLWLCGCGFELIRGRC